MRQQRVEAGRPSHATLASATSSNHSTIVTPPPPPPTSEVLHKLLPGDAPVAVPLPVDEREYGIYALPECVRGNTTSTTVTTTTTTPTATILVAAATAAAEHTARLGSWHILQRGQRLAGGRGGLRYVGVFARQKTARVGGSGGGVGSGGGGGPGGQ